MFKNFNNAMKMPNTKKISILVFLFSILSFNLYPQGSLLLVGGGAEDYNEWSDAPYQWGIDRAQNKRVAIIGYSDTTSWLKNYFLSLGANHAQNFLIDNPTIADDQQTYNDLITFDMIFMRGGDQQDYYETYLGTKTQDALQEVYDNGGVLGGTSAGMALLGDVAFTAQQGTVYPDEAIQNPRISYITLEDDYVVTIDGWIFDTHFIERGRLGRLAAFMENWYIKTGETIKGIGVDDQTAICIYKDSAAFVYGTAAANLIQPGSQGEPFDTVNSTMTKTQNLVLTQLVHENVINLQTGEITGLSNTINTDNEEETGMYTLLLSGSGSTNDNHALLDHITNELNITENILIVTGTSTSTAENMKDYLQNNGATSAKFYQAIQANQSDESFTTAINNADAIILLDNEYNQLMNFLNGGINGNKLNNKIRQDNMITALIGQNAHFAGKKVIENVYSDPAASYYGDFETANGLNLLKTTSVLPRTYELSTDLYENIISAVPWLMVAEELKYGLWIPRESFVKYYFNQDLESYIQYVEGNYPAMMLVNQGCNTDFAGYWNPPRNVAGFESMNYYFLTHDDTVKVGNQVTSGIEKSMGDFSISISPNPVSNYLSITCKGYHGEINIYDISGKPVYSAALNEETTINVSTFKAGTYVIKTHENTLVKKFVIRH